MSVLPKLCSALGAQDGATVREVNGKWFIFEGGQKWPTHAGPYKSKDEALAVMRQIIHG